MKRLVLAALMSGAAIFPADADEMERVAPVTDPLVKEECGACHMAFQPPFLPAQSWQRMMGDLANHFGENASLAPEKTQAILAYYVTHTRPAQGMAVEEAPLRITELRWWQREHDGRHVSQADWQKAGSKANCVACHRGAERGLYEDH